jgi:hypothetical protein
MTLNLLEFVISDQVKQYFDYVIKACFVFPMFILFLNAYKFKGHIFVRRWAYSVGLAVISIPLGALIIVLSVLFRYAVGLPL